MANVLQCGAREFIDLPFSGNTIETPCLPSPCTLGSLALQVRPRVDPSRRTCSSISTPKHASLKVWRRSRREGQQFFSRQTVPHGARSSRSSASKPRRSGNAEVHPPSQSRDSCQIDRRQGSTPNWGQTRSTAFNCSASGNEGWELIT